MTDATSQKMKILSWLKAGKRVSPKLAIKKAQCFRLAARIYDLRQEGYQIECDMSEGYGEYFMLRQKRAA